MAPVSWRRRFVAACRPTRPMNSRPSHLPTSTGDKHEEHLRSWMGLGRAKTTKHKNVGMIRSAWKKPWRVTQFAHGRAPFRHHPTHRRYDRRRPAGSGRRAPSEKYFSLPMAEIVLEVVALGFQDIEPFILIFQRARPQAASWATLSRSTARSVTKLLR